MAAPLETVFKLFAKEGKTVEQSDVGTIVRSQGLCPTNKQLDEQISAAGISGSADLKQVTAVCKSLSDTQRSNLAHDLKESFATFDSQQDGSVLISEISHVLTNMGEKLTEEEVNEVLHAYSANCTDQLGGLDYGKFSSAAVSSVDAAV